MLENISEWGQNIPFFITTGAIGFLAGAIYTWTVAWSYSEHRIRKMIPFNRAIEEYQLDEEYNPATTDKEKAFMKLVEKLKSFQSEMKHSMGREFESEIQNYSEFVADMADRWQPTTQKNLSMPAKAAIKIKKFIPTTDVEVLDKVRHTDIEVLRSYKIVFEEGFNCIQFFRFYEDYLGDADPSGMNLYVDSSYENLNAILVHDCDFTENIWQIFEFDKISNKHIHVFNSKKRNLHSQKVEEQLLLSKQSKHDKSKKGGLPH